MVFNFFKKHCSVCGQDVEKEKAVKRFDEYLCSEEHAEEYRKKLAKEQSKAVKCGKCCG